MELNSIQNDSLLKNKYENIIPIGSIEKLNQEVNSLNYPQINLTEQNKINIPESDQNLNTLANNEIREIICIICQRKFPSEEKLKMHENMSTLHKVIIFNQFKGKFGKVK